jgi:hypothetical protein
MQLARLKIARNHPCLHQFILYRRRHFTFLNETYSGVPDKPPVYSKNDRLQEMSFFEHRAGSVSFIILSIPQYRPSVTHYVTCNVLISVTSTKKTENR